MPNYHVVHLKYIYLYIYLINRIILKFPFPYITRITMGRREGWSEGEEKEVKNNNNNINKQHTPKTASSQRRIYKWFRRHEMRQH